MKLPSNVPGTPWLVLLLSAPLAIFITWKTQHLLRQAYPSDLRLEASQSPEVRLQFTVGLNQLRVNTNPGDRHTEAHVQVTHPTLRELEFQFPLVDGTEVERAIAKELGVSSIAIHSLKQVPPQTQP